MEPCNAFLVEAFFSKASAGTESKNSLSGLFEVKVKEGTATFIPWFLEMSILAVEKIESNIGQWLKAHNTRIWMAP